MRNVVLKSMIIMLLVLLISGCNEEREKKVSKLDPIEKNVDIDSNDKVGLFRKFEKSVPDATVYNDAMFDIDGDGKKDLIVIYDTPEKKVNVAIIAAGRGVSSTSLEGDDYAFTYVLDSLKVYESQKKFIITLHDEAKNFTVDYEITKVYDKEKNAITFKIKSMNAR